MNQPQTGQEAMGGAWLALMLIVLLAPACPAEPITLNAYRSSFITLQQNNYSQTHMPSTGMRVGYDYTQAPYQDYQYRGYAVFDLSGVQTPIASANLQGTMLSSDLPITATFDVREVQTPADQVLTLPMSYPCS